ncbi:MAG TPA: hypothetical protein VKB86_00245 [Pyrinomonadaceae bacterium]|nr:hypothetical protein [Pyrinomonadaceae bacterium]
MKGKTKLKVTHKFSGKPEDIERLMAVQRRLIEIGQRDEKQEKAAKKKGSKK